MLTLQVYPGRGLGFLSKCLANHLEQRSLLLAALGCSLHDTLTKLKAQPQTFPQLDVSYSPRRPLTAPVVLDLPANGIRLRFDGPEQRLRLIEALEFRKTQLSYENIDFVKPLEGDHANSARLSSIPNGPAFRHVYNMMGPTFPGEYIPPEPSSKSGLGLYVLSYPGIAFTFPLQNSYWKPDKDHVSLLSSPDALPAKSFAVFDGSSWQAARNTLFSGDSPNSRILSSPNRGKDHPAEEIRYVQVMGNGRLDLHRRSSSPFRITLSETTAQDLVLELGPPDAIYRKNDRRLAIHRSRNRSGSQSRRYSSPGGNDEDFSENDKSSTNTTTDESDEEEDPSLTSADVNGDPSAECFFNYFHHGLDIFISYPTPPSPAFPSSTSEDVETPPFPQTDHLVATKVLLHANVPGSYPFNRYSRLRWEIDTGGSHTHATPMNSESSFSELSKSLQEIWKSKWGSESQERFLQKGMVLNRGWGDSPGSSCELLGGWEESAVTKRKGSSVVEGPGSGNTELFGFPGLVFEVLDNDTVSCLTVY